MLQHMFSLFPLSPPRSQLFIGPTVINIHMMMPVIMIVTVTHTRAHHGAQ